jgi:hypothetical protein
MAKGATAISAQVGMRLLVPDREPVNLIASLYYSSGDPFAVRIAFHVGTEEPVEWIFDRGLLDDGLRRGPAGLGDVKIYSTPANPIELPSDQLRLTDGEPSQRVHIELSSPFGEAHFDSPHDEFAAFMSRAHRCVEPGTEMDHIDVEPELRGLLNRRPT